MVLSTTTGGGWPSRLAYTAALTFTLASGGTNLVYGWNKGTDLAASLVWAAVSLGASIVFSLSWPGLTASLDRRQWSGALMALFALLLTGTYSVSAAIGSAMGGRTNAALHEQDTSDRRTKIQARYDAAKAELERTKTARAVGEVEALLRAAERNPRSPGCVALGGSTKVSCPKLEAELARARERDRLKADMDKAADELAKIGAPKLANSDAVALARYATDLGWQVDADYLNKLLVLLAVLLVECGGGLSLTLGMALSSSAVPAQDSPASGRTQEGCPGADSTGGQAAPEASSGAVLGCPLGADSVQGRATDGSRSPAAGVRVIELLRARGGVLVGGQRAMAEALGWSKTRFNEVLHDLADRGLVKLDTRPTGTIVRLVPAVAA